MEAAHARELVHEAGFTAQVSLQTLQQPWSRSLFPRSAPRSPGQKRGQIYLYRLSRKRSFQPSRVT